MHTFRKVLAALSCLVLLAGFAGTARASTPTLSLTTTGSGDTIQFNITGGNPSSSAILYYTKQNVGANLYYVGNTNSSGSLSANISASSLNAAPGSSAYVTVGGQSSQSVPWPATTTSGNFSLSQTGAVMTVGQTINITANNANGSIYLSNNSNPPIANVNINGSQIGITALNNGSTTVTVCSGNSSTCASAYITVGSTGTQSLTFSISNVTVSPGQSVPITISGGTGTYTILNNSNSGVIQAGVNGSTVTITTNSTSGSAAITVCSSNLSSCGIINATAGTASTSPLYFSQTSPTLSVNQNLAITLSGGYPAGGSSTTYYVSANSNANVVQTSINSSGLTLTGLSSGTSTITVCSAAGSCGSITATVSYTSTGGSFQLSQSTVSLLVGQVLSVTISGGSTPYNINGGTGSVIQTSLSGNIISISGIGAGTSTLNVCSAGGACLTLTIIVNASGLGTQLTLSQNSLTITPGGSGSVTLSGSGGYYPSSSSNPNIASIQITGNTAVVTGLSAGSDNISICQSGGQCAILFVTVSSGSSTNNVPIFSQTNPSLGAGQTANITVTGGTSSNYYVLTNTNTSIVQTSLINSQLSLTGLANGTSTVVICASSSSCASLTVNVGSTSSTPLTVQTTRLPAPVTNQAYSAQLSTTGGNGTYVYTITSGSLPTGLFLFSSGLISGTPTAAGASNFTVKVTDGLGATTSVNYSLSVTSSGSVTVPPTDSNPTTPTTPATGTEYPNGQLINENGTIYIVYQNTKVGFASAEAFLGLGYDFGNVIKADNSGLAVSPKVVVTAEGAHPRGAWVSSGKTVYFVSPSGMIPVADWNKFISNGGKASLIVPANKYDLARTKLSLLADNDSRLHQ